MPPRGQAREELPQSLPPPGWYPHHGLSTATSSAFCFLPQSFFSGCSLCLKRPSSGKLQVTAQGSLPPSTCVLLATITVIHQSKSKTGCCRKFLKRSSSSSPSTRCDQACEEFCDISSSLPGQGLLSVFFISARESGQGLGYSKCSEKHCCMRVESKMS